MRAAVRFFGRSSNGGLIVTAGSGSAILDDLIITLAARHKLPAVYSDRHCVTGGGLVSYGPDRVDQYRRRRLRRSHLQRREAGRPSAAGTNKV